MYIDCMNIYSRSVEPDIADRFPPAVMHWRSLTN